jgi:hypothetical protein
MNKAFREKILHLLDFHWIMTVATNRPNSWPQATAVAYCNDGLTLLKRSHANVTDTNSDRVWGAASSLPPPAPACQLRDRSMYAKLKGRRPIYWNCSAERRVSANCLGRGSGIGRHYLTADLPARMVFCM